MPPANVPLKTRQDYLKELLRLNIAPPPNAAKLSKEDLKKFYEQHAAIGQQTPSKRSNPSSSSEDAHVAVRPRLPADEDLAMAPAPTRPAPHRPGNVPLAQQEAASGASPAQTAPQATSNVPLSQQQAALRAASGPPAPRPTGNTPTSRQQPAMQQGSVTAGPRRTSNKPLSQQQPRVGGRSDTNALPPAPAASSADMEVPTYEFGPLDTPPASSLATSPNQKDGAPPTQRKPDWADILAWIAIAFVVVLLTALALAPPAPLGIPAPEYPMLPAGSPAAPGRMQLRNAGTTTSPSMVAERFAAVLYLCWEGWQRSVNFTTGAAASVMKAGLETSAKLRYAVDDFSLQGTALAMLDLVAQLVTTILKLSIAVMIQAAYFLGVGLFFFGAKLVSIAYDITEWLVVQAVDDPSTFLGAILTIVGVGLIAEAMRCWRQERRRRVAIREQHVNDAACWIIGHLRAHHEQWAVSSGAGRSLLSGTVRGLVPNRALSSDAIWAEVVACVSKDPCVRCVIDSQGEKRWEWVGYPEGVPARG